MSLYKTLLLSLIFLILGCGDGKSLFKPTIIDPEAILPTVSDEYQECKVRYRSGLYENNTTVIFNLSVVHIFPSSNFLRRFNTDDLDREIAVNLNRAFEEAKIGFNLHDSRYEKSGKIISNFAFHVKDYQEYQKLTLIVYHTDLKSFNGIANNAPGNVAGVHVSRVLTSTLPHEFGHLLGLLHVFDEDFICDTPENNIMYKNLEDCHYIGEAMYSEDDLAILIPNYLSYNQDCRENFSPVQIMAMRFYVENTPILFNAAYY